MYILNLFHKISTFRGMKKKRKNKKSIGKMEVAMKPKSTTRKRRRIRTKRRTVL